MTSISVIIGAGRILAALRGMADQQTAATLADLASVIFDVLALG